MYHHPLPQIALLLALALLLPASSSVSCFPVIIPPASSAPYPHTDGNHDVTTMGSFPNGPWHVDASHHLYGADGRPVTYAGANWPGAEATMVPEGLQYQSVQAIVARIRSLGMNAVRLTYATEMIDHIVSSSSGGGIKKHEEAPAVRDSFVHALGSEKGTLVWSQVLEKNPTFAENITHIQVYDAIITELARNSIYVHLDNHISKAGWCCDPWDGNTWWNDTYFSPANWTRGLAYMAEHAKSAWPNVMSMSLYNELRPPMGLGDDTEDLLDTYNWVTWYDQMKKGASAIHERHPDLLVFLSGLNGDMDLGPVVDGTPLEPSVATFNKTAFAPGFEDKLVLELHSYDIVTPVTDCDSYSQDLLAAGFSAMRPDSHASNNSQETTTTTRRNRFPVMMTEWGFVQDETTWRDGTYAQCVQDFLKNQVPGAGWFVWSLGGSYYVREDKQDADETWGLLNHDWSDWRSPAYIENGLKPLVRDTLQQRA